jgi:hypothetical protein
VYKKHDHLNVYERLCVHTVSTDAQQNTSNSIRSNAHEKAVYHAVVDVVCVYVLMCDRICHVCFKLCGYSCHSTCVHRESDINVSALSSVLLIL